MAGDERAGQELDDWLCGNLEIADGPLTASGRFAARIVPL